MPKILIIAKYYLPGYKSGGPLVSIKNIVSAFSDKFQFNIIASDRDLGDTSPYQNLEPGAPYDINGAQVTYVSPSQQKFYQLSGIIRNTKYDLLYLNSFFSVWPTLYPLLIHKLFNVDRGALLLAPRGELSPEALGKKPYRKKLYLLLFKISGLYKTVNWHASNEFEALDIKNMFGSKVRIYIAPNIPETPANTLQLPKLNDDGVLRIAFIARISAMKNLLFAIHVLSSVRCNIRFNIYGPIEDQTYWNTCSDRLEHLPNNIECCYHGSIHRADVSSTLLEHDLMFLPSLSENFGHIIAESLSVGTRVLISTQTPWRNLLAKNMGRDIDMAHVETFVETIETIALEDSDERKQNRLLAKKGYQRYLQSSDTIESNLNMLNDILASPRNKEYYK